MDNKQLLKIATIVRLDILEMLRIAKSGHAAGPLSATDLFSYIYFEKLNHRPTEPNWKGRDYFLVSNGHIAPVWYSVLARSGYFDLKELKTFRKYGSILQGHPWNIKTPGVFNSSGSLGHGLGQAVGVAIGLKLDRVKNHVYCFTSDGEHQEGAIWEAAMSASKYKLDNLTVIIDCNKIQIDGNISDIMPLDDPTTDHDELALKYAAFMWDVYEIDGHNFDEMRKVFNKPHRKGVPKVVIAHTTAGKGVKEMEGKYQYHDWRHDEALLIRALNELKEKLKSL